MEEETVVVDTNFVVYGFYREDWTPFYIGKGRPGRPYQKGGRPCGSPPRERILILYKDMTEKEAFKKEEELIKRYGRLDLDPENGLLYNRTYGGDGASGAVRSEEFKENLSVNMTGEGNHMYGRHHTDESKIRISNSKRGRNNGLVGENHPSYGTTWTEERRKKMSERMSGENNPMYGKSKELAPNWGVKFSEEHCRKISEANSGENHPNFGKSLPESTKRKLSERMSGSNHPQYGRTGELSPNFGKKHTEESKRKMSESKMGDKHPNYTPRNWCHDIYGVVLNKSSAELIRMFPGEKLNKGALSQVALGKASHHKGWKLHKI
jgi:hypothetical protein